jgi:hypothetical protein
VQVSVQLELPVQALVLLPLREQRVRPEPELPQRAPLARPARS